MTLAMDIKPDGAAVVRAVGELSRAMAEAKDLDAGLRAVCNVSGADRVALLVFEPHAEVVLRAGTASGRLSELEWEEISRSVVRAARETGRAAMWDVFDASDEDSSLAELGVLAAIATPLRDGDAEALGVLYVDVRTPGKCLADGHVAFLEIAASTLGLQLAAERRTERAVREARPATPRTTLPLFDLIASPAMSDAAAAVRSALGTDLNVLVTGESGTGKTELAMALATALGDGPVVRATLGMSDDLNTLTSELFGHERGSFSGAAGRRVGLVERAHGGTLFFDEVLNLASPAQQLLLDFTQFGHFRPLGYDGAEPRHAHVRILAATQGDLSEAIILGHFRRDLYYRLAGVEVHLPSLRDRRADIPGLAESLLRRRDPSRAWHLALPLRRALVSGARRWDGNLRELEAVMERARQSAAARSADACEIGLDDIAEGLAPAPAAPAPTPARGTPTSVGSLEQEWARLGEDRGRLAAWERRLIERGLREESGVVSRVARRLGVPRTTLLHRMVTLGLRGTP